MRTQSLQFDARTLAWREFWDAFWEKIAPRCSRPDCASRQSFWRRLRRRPLIILLGGARYCPDRCLERALTESFRHVRSAPLRTLAPHRIPLGLVLLSRQQLTAEQLRTALAVQHTAGRGRIGEWLQTLGFASELQVTAALARQWSCPVLRPGSVSSDSISPSASSSAGTTTPRATTHAPQIPFALLESLVMIPVEYVAATGILHMAFGEGIDYGVLYAIEQMTGCRTEPCMAVPSLLRQRLQSLSQRRGESEVVFDRVADTAELARIVRSYCVRLAACEIKLVVCGPHLWVRLFRSSSPPLDLLLGAPRESAGLVSRPPLPASIPPV